MRAVGVGFVMKRMQMLTNELCCRGAFDEPRDLFDGTCVTRDDSVKVRRHNGQRVNDAPGAIAIVSDPSPNRAALPPRELYRRVPKRPLSRATKSVIMRIARQ